MTTNAVESSASVQEAQRAGKVTFLGVELLVGPGALVPRAETEILGRQAQSILVDMTSPPEDVSLVLIDMCCGSGNLACALAAGDRRLRVYAADLTESCIELAQRNIASLGLGDRVSAYRGDLFAALAGVDLAGKVDVIVCNPPYISTGRLSKDRAALLELEPVEAFDGGPYGLSIHQRVIREAPQYLKSGGWLSLEFGVGQEKQVKLLFDRAGAYRDLRFVPDAEGRPRVATAWKV